MATHECKQAERIDRVHAELYLGTEGRQPVTVRLAQAERILASYVYISTAVMLSSIIGAGTVLWRTVSLAQDLKATSAYRPTAQPAAPYEAAPAAPTAPTARN